jgi:hypothetical protein
VPAAIAGEPPGAADPVYALALDARTQRFTQGVRNVWAQSGIALAGTLRSSAGVAAAGVAVSLFARSAVDAAARVVARATTDGTGRWRLRAPRGPSRTLTITYGARPDPGSAQAITIRQTVRPRVSLRVEAIGGGWLRFTGRVRLQPLGSPRPLVVVQTRTLTGAWRALGAVRASRSGAYGVTYPGDPDVIGGTYAFRTVTRRTQLFATGISRVRRASVR